MSNLYQCIKKTLENHLNNDFPCVKFDTGSEKLTNTFGQVKLIVDQLSDYFEQHFSNRNLVIGLDFNVNKPSIIYILPAIIAILKHPTFSFQVLNPDSDEEEFNALISPSVSNNSDSVGPLFVKNLHFNDVKVKDSIYQVKTSGTTPGGQTLISVFHDSIWPNFCDFSRIFGLDHSDVIFSAAPPTFDPFYLDVLLSFLSSACLLLTSQKVKIQSGKKLSEILKCNHVTFCQMTPSLFRSLNTDFPPLKYLLLGGEAFPTKNEIQAVNWNCQTKLFNLYGLTEMSVWQSMVEVSDLYDEIPIYTKDNLLSEVRFSVQVQFLMVYAQYYQRFMYRLGNWSK